MKGACGRKVLVFSTDFSILNVDLRWQVAIDVVTWAVPTNVITQSSTEASRFGNYKLYGGSQYRSGMVSFR